MEWECNGNAVHGSGSTGSRCRDSFDLVIPQTSLSQILKGAHSITADAALRLSQYFDNAVTFWLGLQNDYDLEEAKRAKAEDLKNTAPFSAGNTSATSA